MSTEPTPLQRAEALAVEAGKGVAFADAMQASATNLVASMKTPPPPVEEPKPPPVVGAGNACLPFVHINWNQESGTTWKEAAATGAKGGRASGNLFNLATAAQSAGMKLCYLVTNVSGGIGAAISAYNALTPALKAVVVCIECGNEDWPGGVKGTSGKAYGGYFVRCAKEGREAGLPIPVLCQVRIAKDVRLAWMDEMLAVPGMKEALEGNWLASHPYYHSMMLPKREPLNPAACIDTSGNEWAGQRWMAESDYVYRKLGVRCPVAITEYGSAEAAGVPDSEGSWANVAQTAAHLHQFMTLVKTGTVPAAWLPSVSYVPQLAFATWYDLHGNRTGAETFGLYLYAEAAGPKGPNENGSVFATYRSSASALVAA
jgi:hypothetical protein